MDAFSQEFFMELNKLNRDRVKKIKPKDHFRLRLSDVGTKIGLNENFMYSLEATIQLIRTYSEGRYEFEQDFYILHPRSVCTHTKGLQGHKQLYISLSSGSVSPSNNEQLGASIGLNFDFRNPNGVYQKCIDEYQSFYMHVYNNQEIFDSVFGGLGGYSEPCMDIGRPLISEILLKSTPSILAESQFFGKNIVAQEVLKMGSLSQFAYECIEVFDLIVKAGYFKLTSISINRA